MAKRRGWWAEIQREHAWQQRLVAQSERAYRQEQVRAQREAAQVRRAAEREAAATERERKRLYIESRKAEATDLTVDLRERLAELDSVLVSGLDGPPPLTFTAMKRTVQVPRFDAGGLDQPLPPPRWEDFAPPLPGTIGRLFGSGRYRREEAAAQQRFSEDCARHAQADQDRLAKLAQRRRSYDEWTESVAAEVEQHNLDVAGFETRSTNSSARSRRSRSGTRA